MVGSIALNVLHVEDDPADAVIVGESLRESSGPLHSYNVEHVENLTGALQKLKESQYSVVLLDLGLPDGNGLENIQSIKNVNPDIPVIVVTGLDDDRMAIQALREGAQEYLVKNNASYDVMQRTIQSSIFRKRAEIELARKAFHDPLTGLPNRMAFENTAWSMIQRAQRWDMKDALMFIDLNKFKEINDTHGHEAGNIVLKETAKRLKNAVRNSDLVARYAGDEFVVYLDSGREPATEAVCMAVAEKIIKAVEKPIDVGNLSLEIGLSIGIAIYPEAGQTFDLLLKNADQAMYRAKNDPDRKYWIVGREDDDHVTAGVMETNLPAPVNTNIEQQRILIIDDSPEDRALYKNILQDTQANFKIMEAGSIREGLRLMEKETPDCILLDHYLPDLNGIDFLEKQQEEGRALPAALVMMTGREDRETAVQAMKLGAKDYIVKGEMDHDRFVHVISGAIERDRLERALKTYRKDLERSHAELSDFAQTVAHDLKAPMRKIFTFCEALEKKGEMVLDEESRRYIERMSVSSRRMQELIDNLLTYARVMKPTEEREELSLVKLVSEVTEDLHIWLQDHNALVTISPLPTLPVYPVRMQQLFANLITNAVKYRRPDEKPIIEIQAEKGETDDEVIIAIRDNGMGMPEEVLKSIFMPFHRLHGADDIEGTGLGLSICQKVAEKHGGKIWAESKEGMGSTFRFSVPG